MALIPCRLCNHSTSPRRFTCARCWESLSELERARMVREWMFTGIRGDTGHRDPLRDAVEANERHLQSTIDSLRFLGEAPVGGLSKIAYRTAIRTAMDLLLAHQEFVRASLRCSARDVITTGRCLYSARALHLWLRAPNVHLLGRRPADLLRQGEAAVVLADLRGRLDFQSMSSTA